MSAARTQIKKFDAEPVLRKIYSEARKDDREVQQMFSLLGWSDVPDELKYEIREDVRGMIDELRGQYSTCDPQVLNRRKRVVYWVCCYLDGICGLQSAVDALSY